MSVKWLLFCTWWTVSISWRQDRLWGFLDVDSSTSFPCRRVRFLHICSKVREDWCWACSSLENNVRVCEEQVQNKWTWIRFYTKRKRKHRQWFVVTSFVDFTCSRQTCESCCRSTPGSVCAASPSRGCSGSNSRSSPWPRPMTGADRWAPTEPATQRRHSTWGSF